MENKKNAYRSSISAGIILFLIMGASNILGVIAPNLLFDLNISLTKVGLVSSFAAATSIIMSFLVPKFISVLTPKWCIFIGSIISALHLVVFGIAQNEYYMYAGAIMTGFALGLGAHATIATLINGWFDSKKATSLVGVLFGISVFGGAVYPFIAGRLMLIMDWRKLSIIIGLVTLVLVIVINLLFIKNPPTEPINISNLDNAEDTDVAPPVYGVLFKDVIKSPSFYLCFISLIGFAMLIPVSNFATTFWQSNGLAPATAATYYSLMALIGGLLTMLTGFITNKVGAKGLTLSITVIYVLGIVCALNWSTKQITILLLISLVGHSIVQGLNALPSLTVTELFGNKDFSKISGFGMAAYYIGSAITTTLFGSIITNRGFTFAYTVLAGIAIAAFVLFLLAILNSPMRKK